MLKKNLSVFDGQQYGRYTFIKLRIELSNSNLSSIIVESSL